MSPSRCGTTRSIATSAHGDGDQAGDHQRPAEALHQAPGDERRDRGADGEGHLRQRRPRARSSAARSGPLNMFWMKPETCGVIRPPPAPWITRATEIHSALWLAPQAALARVNSATPTMKTVRRERASPEPAGGHERHAEGQGVPGDHPLDVAVVGGEARADRGQRDVDDAHVEQAHAARDQAHDQGAPPVAGARPRAPTRCPGRSWSRRHASRGLTADRGGYVGRDRHRERRTHSSGQETRCASSSPADTARSPSSSRGW